LATFHTPPSTWVHYVDDVYAIMETQHIDSFHLHLNTINNSIKFTKELEASGSLAFLDVHLTREPKPTSTGRYLPHTSHHPPTQKLSIARTLLACLHDLNKSGFFGGPAFFQPIRAF